MIVDKTSDIQKAFARFLPIDPPAPVIAKTDDSIPKPVTARLSYTVVGVCPYCSTPMGFTEACGQRVYLCEKDRFVSPLPNEEL